MPFSSASSGDLSLMQALILLAILLLFGLLILLQFNNHVRVAGVVALGLVVTYPLMKRITFYPQIFLGLAFNYGILMADLQLHRTIELSSILLYLACIIWTLIYDTIYAFQDIEDDLKIGVKSSAIKFQNNPKIILTSLMGLMLALFGFSGFLQNLAIHFYITLAIAFVYLGYIITHLDYSNQKQCLKGFKDNVAVGILILFAIILG